MGKGGERPPKAFIISEENKELLSGASYAATMLAPEDAWMATLDHEALKDEIGALGKELAAEAGPADVAHLRKIVWWSRLCSWVGFATCMYSVNVVSVFLLSLGTLTRWTIIGHHVCHGGFDKCDKSKTYNRFKFGVGSLWRRTVDWLDWMLVEAWNVEHNQLHHYHLGETADPDLVEMNLEYLRDLDAPRPVKYLACFAMAVTWKWWYYAPNTFKALKCSERRRAGRAQLPGSEAPQTFDFGWLVGLGDNTFVKGSEVVLRVLGPYFARQFLILPLPVLLLGGWPRYKVALANLFLAELATNLHSFIVVATNHAGDDLYRFASHCKPRSATFYLRQIVSSANFDCGTDVVDFLHGWLNYQVEHHLWPDLSMLAYQKAQPRIQAICAKHGVPYIKENVFWRVHKLTQIMVGAKSMRKYPHAFEHAPDIVSKAAEAAAVKEHAAMGHSHDH
jgi:fatty acid desaturase